MAATQLAWSVASAIGPLLYAFLLHHGAWAAWGGSLVMCALWSGTVEVLAARMPLASQAVTNEAEPVTPDEPIPALDPAPPTDS
jgi:MFS family permease